MKNEVNLDSIKSFYTLYGNQTKYSNMNKKISHSHDFKCSGLWWLPKRPENELLGDLSYSPKEDGHIWLTIYGGLSGGELNLEIGDNIPAMLGFVEGKLYSCVSMTLGRKKHVFGNPSYTEYRFIVHYIIQGQHISESRPLFQELNFESVGMKNYLAPRTDGHLISNSKGKEYGFLPYESISVNNVTLERKPTWETKENKFSSEGNVFLRISSDEEDKPLEWFSSQAYRVRQLVDLLSGSVSPIEYIYIKEKSEIFPILQGATFDVDKVSINGFVHKPKIELVPFSTIEGIFSEILKVWLNIDDDLTGVYHQLYRAIRGDYLFFEDRFFSLSQSLETLHTISNSNTEFSFKERCLNLLELYHGKYKELDKFNTHEWQAPIPDARTLEEIAEEIKEFRNQFTHPINKKTGKPKPRKEVPAFLEKRLKALLYVILFDQLGLPTKPMNQVIRLHTGL